MKSVQANLFLELNVRCPHCDYLIDLINDVVSSEFEGNINETGIITQQSVGSIDWEKSHKEFNENILCALNAIKNLT